MHPIERLRYVARATGADTTLLARETAGALAGFADDPAGLVMACRRIVARHPLSGPLWWLCSRVLVAVDPVEEAWRAADELEADRTPRRLVDDLPAEARVLAVDWSSELEAARSRRGDLTVLRSAEARPARRRRRNSAWWDEDDDLRDDRWDDDAWTVPALGLGAAAADADVVVLDASAVGPEAFVAPSGSLAAAAVARHAGREVWVAAGVGRLLPTRVWAGVQRGAEELGEPWDRPVDLVPLDLATRLAGPDGGASPAEALRRTDCPIAPELLHG